jgi:hypothetical protein
VSMGSRLRSSASPASDRSRIDGAEKPQLPAIARAEPWIYGSRSGPSPMRCGMPCEGDTEEGGVG